MKKLSAAIALMVGCASIANATITTYYVKANDGAGKVLSGSFGIDSEAPGNLLQFKNIDLRAGSFQFGPWVNGLNYSGASEGQGDIFVSINDITDRYSLLFGFSAFHDQLKIGDVATSRGLFNIGIVGNYTPEAYFFNNGEIADRAFGAVPEPASWAMMIGGFGVIGASIRRRKIATV
jgi:hypothetical protein